MSTAWSHEENAIIYYTEYLRTDGDELVWHVQDVQFAVLRITTLLARLSHIEESHHGS